jgi:site-specific DNA-methyltransferase (adenine-specific)
MELMARYEDGYFDLAIVDPPYGIDRFKKGSGTTRYKMDARVQNNGIQWDIKPKHSFFKELFRVSKNQIVWGYNHLSELLPCCTAFIFWDKDVSVNNYSAGELAYSSFEGVAKKVKIVWDGFRQEDMKNKETRIHPTQKPVKLYEWLLMNYAKEGDKILDTHLGSGSIAIACHNLRYDLTACEIDKKYFDDAIQRLQKHKSQKRLF